uniref:Uncharacterized protein n=1 Tax=Arundo donax TaxID=35708 RepID=A0A0A9CAY5_ARUDO
MTYTRAFLPVCPLPWRKPQKRKAMSPTVTPLPVGFWSIHPKLSYMIFKLLSVGFES